MKIETKEDGTILIDGVVYKPVIKEELKEKRRWKPGIGKIYFIVHSDGSIKKWLWENVTSDKVYWKAGNAFPSEEAAKKSMFYFMLNSEYHYWVFGMDIPEETPEECEIFSKRHEVWKEEISNPNTWRCIMRRWPKHVERSET